MFSRRLPGYQVELASVLLFFTWGSVFKKTTDMNSKCLGKWSWERREVVLGEKGSGPRREGNGLAHYFCAYL